ncbi:hypothetical protein [Streptomyces sp. NPDC048057]|uniref:hypothetical protein n=1 Tax=Streptomyces sp. NPDC048057 TaxID=3155628 RepID=UPI0033DE91EF
MKTSSASRATREAEFTLDELRGDCARMAPHWSPPAKDAPRPVSPSLIHGVVVPAASARLARGMFDY